MSSQRYRFRSEDIERIRQWLFRNRIFPPDAQAGIEKLQMWCETHLDKNQWFRLQKALESHRGAITGYRTIRVTASAHEILMEMAKRENLTISEAIERYYSRFIDSAATTTHRNGISPARRTQTKPKRVKYDDG
jgi:hypothetical protein